MNEDTAKPADDDSLDVDLSDTATAQETQTLATASSAFNPAATGTPTARGGRQSTGGPFITAFVNCDMQPDNPDSKHNFSSMVHAEGLEPGIAQDKSYGDAYKRELAVVNLCKSMYGIPFTGNGNIGRWRAPWVGADGKQVVIDGVPQERMILCTNLPERYQKMRDEHDAKANGTAPARTPRAAAATPTAPRASAADQLRSQYGIPEGVPLPGSGGGRGSRSTTAPTQAATRATTTTPAAPLAPPPAPLAAMNLDDALAAIEGGTSGGFGDEPPAEEPEIVVGVVEETPAEQPVEVVIEEQQIAGSDDETELPDGSGTDESAYTDDDLGGPAPTEEEKTLFPVEEEEATPPATMSEIEAEAGLTEQPEPVIEEEPSTDEPSSPIAEDEPVEDSKPKRNGKK